MIKIPFPKEAEQISTTLVKVPGGQKKCDEVEDATEELEKIKKDLETKRLEIVSFKDQFNTIEAKNRELADQQEEFRTKNQFVIRENEDLKCDLKKQVEQNISTQTLLVKLKKTLKMKKRSSTF